MREKEEEDRLRQIEEYNAAEKEFREKKRKRLEEHRKKKEAKANPNKKEKDLAEQLVDNEISMEND